ncbi:hypothetical protein [Litoribrevibacter albus]|uniref:Uncharacterized protein n=1 Tax=Litoribrevibacter albus TaxID=1473156 RepID=A0AA37SAG5_9GAMM|nr:hypothetical protein [Litoribrevibacter albus]GLQ31719.1 hypothetical protein GCM10007876_21980 [Litoribrevibacter albus]
MSDIRKKLSEWINEPNPVKQQWIYNYLAKRGLSGQIRIDPYSPNNRYINEQIPDSNLIILNDRIRKAWSQKIHREKKGLKSFNFIMSEHIEKQLRYLAKNLNKNLKDTLESILLNTYKTEREQQERLKAEAKKEKALKRAQGNRPTWPNFENTLFSKGSTEKLENELLKAKQEINHKDKQISDLLDMQGELRETIKELQSTSESDQNHTHTSNTNNTPKEPEGPPNSNNTSSQHEEVIIHLWDKLRARTLQMIEANTKANLNLALDASIPDNQKKKIHKKVATSVLKDFDKLKQYKGIRELIETKS